MKHISLLFFCCISILLRAQKDLSLHDFNLKYDQFLENHLINGRVDYKNISKEYFNPLIEFVRTFDTKDVTKKTLKAFRINAYNLLVIEQILENYPTRSVQDIPGFFDINKVHVENRKMSLNTYEKELIFKTFNDPRLHFVLNCGAISCPPLHVQSFKPDQVDKQIESIYQASFSNPLVFQVNDTDQKLYLSTLFKWYASDLKEMLEKIIQTKNPNQFPISYMAYDWTLNDRQATTTVLTSATSDFQPIIVSSTLPKQIFEFNFFHSLFTANYGTMDNGSRSSFFTGLYFFSIGVNGRFDIGFDMLVKSNVVNDRYQSSPFNTLLFRQAIDSISPSLTRISETGISQLGPRIRFAPFKKINLAFEQAFYFPVQNIPTPNQVDPSFFWVTQVFFDHLFSDKLGIFFALTFWQSIQPQAPLRFQAPFLKTFLSWYPNNRWTFFLTNTSFIEWGGGVKFLITPNFELQGMYTIYAPIPGIRDLYIGNAQNVMTFNLGLRYRVAIK